MHPRFFLKSGGKNPSDPLPLFFRCVIQKGAIQFGRFFVPIGIFRTNIKFPTFHTFDSFLHRKFDVTPFYHNEHLSYQLVTNKIDMRYIQYLGETLPLSLSPSILDNFHNLK